MENKKESVKFETLNLKKAGFESGDILIYGTGQKSTIKKRIVSLEGNSLTYEVVTPLLFNQNQRHIINYHPSKLTERYIYYTLLRVWRWLR